MAFGMDRKSEWHDWATLFFGILLFFCPWFFGFAGMEAAALNAWIGGALVVVLAILALRRFAEWEEWVMGAIGLWLVLSPWLLGFTDIVAGTWSAIVLGALIVISAAWKLYELHGGGRHVPVH